MYQTSLLLILAVKIDHLWGRKMLFLQWPSLATKWEKLTKKKFGMISFKSNYEYILYVNSYEGKFVIRVKWFDKIDPKCPTQCAKDCGLCKSTCSALVRAIQVFTPVQAVFLKIVPYFFISIGEELSQPTKHANKIIVSIFWLWRPQSLTHTVVYTSI